VAREEVPAEVVEREREIYREQMANSGKPAHIVDQIIQGKLDKWFSEVCLLEQAYIRDPDITIQALLVNSVASLGENIRVNRFARLQIGG
jgi:elongation factor Ts